MIKQCTCSAKSSPAAEYQDKKYGEGNRVHTPLGAKRKGVFRCTVCKTERS